MLLDITIFQILNIIKITIVEEEHLDNILLNKMTMLYIHLNMICNIIIPVN